MYLRASKRTESAWDLVSTSETNVTASFDPGSGVLPDSTIDALMDDLKHHCEAKLLRCVRP